MVMGKSESCSFTVNFSNIWYKKVHATTCHINAQKSKIMLVSRQDNISVQVDHEEKSLEQVHDFKF